MFMKLTNATSLYSYSVINQVDIWKKDEPCNNSVNKIDAYEPGFPISCHVLCCSNSSRFHAIMIGMTSGCNIRDILELGNCTYMYLVLVYSKLQLRPFRL